MKRILALMSALAVSGLLLLVAGCSKNNPAAPNLAPELGQCRFTISAAEDVASGQVVLTKGQQRITLPITITGHSGTVFAESLEVGTWTIDVKLFNSVGDEIYSGQGSALVRKGLTTQVTIKVQPASGSLQITVEVPYDQPAVPYRIVYKDTAGRLMAINEDGSAPEPASGASWSMDGYYFDVRPTDNYILYSQSSALYQMRPDGTGATPVNVEGGFARYSQAGDRIVCFGSSARFTCNLTGGAKQTLNMSASVERQVVWTSDNRLLYTEWDNTAQQWKLYVMGSDGTNRQFIDTGALSVMVDDCSRDGVILFHDRSGGALYTLNLDGAGLHKLADAGELAVGLGSARFSADGQKIVCACMGAKVNQIWTLYRDGTGLAQVPDVLGTCAAFFYPAQ